MFLEEILTYKTHFIAIYFKYMAVYYITTTVRELLLDFLMVRIQKIIFLIWLK